MGPTEETIGYRCCSPVSSCTFSTEIQYMRLPFALAPYPVHAFNEVFRRFLFYLTKWFFEDNGKSFPSVTHSSFLSLESQLTLNVVLGNNRPCFVAFYTAIVLSETCWHRLMRGARSKLPVLSSRIHLDAQRVFRCGDDVSTSLTDNDYWPLIIPIWLFVRVRLDCRWRSTFE